MKKIIILIILNCVSVKGQDLVNIEDVAEFIKTKEFEKQTMDTEGKYTIGYPKALKDIPKKNKELQEIINIIENDVNYVKIIDILIQNISLISRSQLRGFISCGFHLKSWNKTKEHAMFRLVKACCDKYESFLKFPFIPSYSLHSIDALEYLNYIKKIDFYKKKHLEIVKYNEYHIEKIKKYNHLLQEFLKSSKEYKCYLSYSKDYTFPIIKIKTDKWAIKSIFKFNKFEYGWYYLQKYNKITEVEEKNDYIKSSYHGWYSYMFPVLKTLNTNEKIFLNNNIFSIIKKIKEQQVVYYGFKTSYHTKFTPITNVTWNEVKMISPIEQDSVGNIAYMGNYFRGLVIQIANSDNNVQYVLDLPMKPICNELKFTLKEPRFYRIIELYYNKDNKIENIMIGNYLRNKEIDKLLEDYCIKENIGVRMPQTYRTKWSIGNKVPVMFNNALPYPTYCPLNDDSNVVSIKNYYEAYEQFIENENKQNNKMQKSIDIKSMSTNVKKISSRERYSKIEKELEMVKEKIPDFYKEMKGICPSVHSLRSVQQVTVRYFERFKTLEESQLLLDEYKSYKEKNPNWLDDRSINRYVSQLKLSIKYRIKENKEKRILEKIKKNESVGY